MSKRTGLKAKVVVAFSLVLKDAAGNVVKTIPVKGSIPLEKTHGMDHRGSGQQSRP